MKGAGLPNCIHAFLVWRLCSAAIFSTSKCARFSLGTSMENSIFIGLSMSTPLSSTRPGGDVYRIATEARGGPQGAPTSKWGHPSRAGADNKIQPITCSQNRSRRSHGFARFTGQVDIGARDHKQRVSGNHRERLRRPVTMRLSDARMRRHPTKLIYPKHRLLPRVFRQREQERLWRARRCDE